MIFLNLARTSFHRELPKTCRENVFKMQVFHVPIPLLLGSPIFLVHQFLVQSKKNESDLPTKISWPISIFNACLCSSPNFLYELQYKHLAMKFEDSESRGQILISRHSTPTFPQKQFPAAVDALCFHPCRPRRFKPTAHTSFARPPCHPFSSPMTIWSSLASVQKLVSPEGAAPVEISGMKEHRGLRDEIKHWDSIKQKKSLFKRHPAACLGLVSPLQQVQLTTIMPWS